MRPLPKPWANESESKTMTQIATVEKILSEDYAEISVPRKSACGHDCEECAGCGVTGTAVHARARNPIAAQPGQKVVVESSTEKLMGIILLVYMVPVVLFFAGFSALLGAGSGVRAAVGALSFLLGILPAVLYDRRLRAQGGLIFRIVRLF